MKNITFKAKPNTFVKQYLFILSVAVKRQKYKTNP